MKAFIENPNQFWTLPPATSQTTGICILGIIPRIGHHNAGSTVLFSDSFTLWCLLWFFAARAPRTALFPWVHGRNSRNISYSSPISRSPNFTSGSELAELIWDLLDACIECMKDYELADKKDMMLFAIIPSFMHSHLRKSRSFELRCR